MTFPERDVHKMIAEFRVTYERVHARIQVREFASSHGLKQMRHLRMLEEQKAWKGEDGLDRNQDYS